MDVSYCRLIQTEFDRRRRLNSAYSLRAFSNYLEVSPAQLSQILSGKRPLTMKTGLKIADRLGLSPLERREFFESLIAKEPLREATARLQLKEEVFQLISDWLHFALLSLAEIQPNSKDPRWLSERLGVKPEDCKSCLERLVHLQLVEIKGRQFYPTQQSLGTSEDIPSEAIRRFHQKNLELAAEKLDSVPVELRDFSAITMAIDPDKLELAKKKIRAFRKEMAELLESGNQKEVYMLNVQLMPLSRSMNGGKS